MAGKIISTKFMIGNITHLKTRNIYKIIESRPPGIISLIYHFIKKQLRRSYFGKTTLKLLTKDL